MNDAIRVHTGAIQREIDQLDRTADRDKLIWAHGLISGILDQVAARLGTGFDSRINTRDEMKVVRESLARATAALRAINRSPTDRPVDSLERLCDDLDDPDQPPDLSSVPARKKPGPTGRSGSAAEKLPN
jgi:hypothetical protein